MREAEFQKWVTDVAERCGWKVWHVPAPMVNAGGTRGWVGARQAAGLPDLVMLHDDPPRLVFAEVKGDGGKLSEKQIEFLQAAKLVAELAADDRFPNDADEAQNRRVLGVFLFEPGMEDLIERMLKTKVVA